MLEVALQRGRRAMNRRPVGATGATGATGPVGLPDYGYIYNVAPQTVAIEADVSFDSNGPVSGVVHTPGTSEIVVMRAGTYLVDFSVSGSEPDQFAVMVNGFAAAGSTYGAGAGTQQNNGDAILTLGAGAVLTLRNHSSAAAVTLASVVGGTQANVSASMVVERLG